MKEHPILFSGPMVRAILEGRKTQTRRAVVARHVPDLSSWSLRGLQVYPDGGLRAVFDGDEEPVGVPCPYGAPGDRLWVRETWAGDDCCGYVYRADHPDADLRAGDLDDGEQSIRRWHPSIHMPRAASRLTLALTAVRVERLHDISDADIEAEGVTSGTPPCLAHLRRAVLRDGWERLWKSTAGIESWNANPWVWALSFEVVR